MGSTLYIGWLNLMYIGWLDLMILTFLARGILYRTDLKGSHDLMIMAEAIWQWQASLTLSNARE